MSIPAPGLQSGVNKKGEGFVQLLLDGEVSAQFSSSEARLFGKALIEAAEASETDAFLMSWATNIVGIEYETAGVMLIEFRKYREEQTGKKHGAQNAFDWIMPGKKQ